MTLTEQIKCVEREIALRRGVYPKWVAQGKLKQADADWEIKAMESIRDTLRACRDLQVDCELFGVGNPHFEP